MANEAISSAGGDKINKAGVIQKTGSLTLRHPIK